MPKPKHSTGKLKAKAVPQGGGCTTTPTTTKSKCTHTDVPRQSPHVHTLILNLYTP